MGKTSALINFYVRHRRRWRKPYKLELIPLGIPDADEKIQAIDDKPNTVLLLDALDEDTQAITDHNERIRHLLDATGAFQRLLITCRTQFFAREEEIPEETGVLKRDARPAGEAAEYYFYKAYLTPFSDAQVTKYIKLRYPLWRVKRRRQALNMVKKIPQLAARPMLLAHVDDLVKASRAIHYSFELYEEMVQAWINREKGFIRESEELRRFSEMLAVNIFLNRRKRGSELIARSEIKELAEDWGITIHLDKFEWAVSFE